MLAILLRCLQLSYSWLLSVPKFKVFRYSFDELCYFGGAFPWSLFLHCLHPQVWLSVGKGGNLVNMRTYYPTGYITTETEFLQRHRSYAADSLAICNNLIKDLCRQSLPGYDDKYNLHPG